MVDTKISALTLAATVADANEFAINEAGTSKKVTGTLLRAYVGDTIRNQSTADQTINAATTAYLTGSNLTVPTGKLRIGTNFWWRIALSKTAAGTAANTFDVRVGTLGTTGDTSRLAFTTATGTAVIDQGWIDIVVTCRGPLSASGIFSGHLAMGHELDITGLQNKASRFHQITSSAFDVTTANLIVGLSCTTAASTVLTFQQVVASASNL